VKQPKETKEESPSSFSNVCDDKDLYPSPSSFERKIESFCDNLLEGQILNKDEAIKRIKSIVKRDYIKKEDEREIRAECWNRGFDEATKQEKQKVLDFLYSHGQVEGDLYVIHKDYFKKLEKLLTSKRS
jgi:hypothetical protein